DVPVAEPVDRAAQRFAVAHADAVDLQTRGAGALAAQAIEEGNRRALRGRDLAHADRGLEALTAPKRRVELLERARRGATAFPRRCRLADCQRRPEEALPAVVLLDELSDPVRPVGVRFCPATRTATRWFGRTAAGVETRVGGRGRDIRLARVVVIADRHAA